MSTRELVWSGCRLNVFGGGCWFGFIWVSCSECIEAVGDWHWFSVFSVLGFRLPTLADLDCLLQLGWIKCATDRGRGSAVTRWVELSATCCLYLVKTGGDLISPGSHKLDRPTCCLDPLLIFPLTFKECGKYVQERIIIIIKKNFNRILIRCINLCKWRIAAVWIGVLNCLPKHRHVGCM